MLTIRTLGPMQIDRDGEALAPPASRKARAILGFLLLAPRPVGRQRLCELFFDIPDDPRASLRWNLTKLRAVTDEGEVKRIVTSGDALKFDPAGARIDVLDLLRGGAEAGLPEGDGLFLEDADLPDRPDYSAWLESAREEVRAATVRRLATQAEATLAAQDRLPLYRRLLALAPLDEDGNAGLARTLAQLGRADDAREAVAAAERAMARAGLKPGSSLRAALKPAPPPADEAPAIMPRYPAMQSTRLFDMLPGVALLSFHNYSPDIVPHELADGMLESTVHMLSRFRSLRVSAVHDAPDARNRMQDPAAIRAATGADFIVGGSLMARGQAVKVRYRIVDALNGALLSSGDIDKTVQTGAAMLEDVPEALVAHLVHQLYELARHRAGAVPEPQRNAIDHYLCGISSGFLGSPLNYREALRCFEACLAREPDFGGAMAGAAWAKALLGQSYREPALSEAIALANRAITCANDDANTLSIAAWSLIQLGGDVGTARRAIDLAIKVNPLARAAWNISAWIRAMSGEYDLPMQHWERAETCSPLGASLEQINGGRALCCWMARRVDEAGDWARRSLERGPNNPGSLAVALAVAAERGDARAAVAAVRLMLAHYPEGLKHPAMTAVPMLVAGEKARILKAMEDAVVLAGA